MLPPQGELNLDTGQVCKIATGGCGGRKEKLLKTLDFSSPKSTTQSTLISMPTFRKSLKHSADWLFVTEWLLVVAVLILLRSIPPPS